MKKVILQNYLGELGDLDTSTWETYPSGSMETPKNEYDTEIKPPLSLDPPPNIVPLPMMNQEWVDTDSEMEEKVESKPEELLQEMAETKPMCRDYIRGNCKRANCNFAHECDLKQLYNVYSFCHNFQNSFCKYVNCKYVHATVFEEQEFYRTGSLPPHVFTGNKAQLLSTPPPEEKFEKNPNGMYKFCQQFQISHCTFENCTYVHATKWEEHYFYKTGFLGPHTLNHIKDNKDQVQLLTSPPPPKASPVDSSVTSPSMMNNMHMDVSSNATQACSMQDLLPPAAHPHGPAATHAAICSKILDLLNMAATLKNKIENPRVLEPNKCRNCDLLETKVKFREEILALMSMFDNTPEQGN